MFLTKGQGLHGSVRPNTQRVLELRITEPTALDLNLSRSAHEADSSSLTFSE
jgi:hypothetical protein